MHRLLFWLSNEREGMFLVSLDAKIDATTHAHAHAHAHASASASVDSLLSS